jgi:tight adherence protein C
VDVPYGSNQSLEILMNNLILFILFLIFILVFAGSFFIAWTLSNKTLNQRLNRIKKQSLLSENARGLVKNSISKSLMQDLVKLSMPKEKWETSPLRIHFWRAGYPNQDSVFIYYSLKTLLFISLLVISFLYIFRSGYSLLMILFLSFLCSAIGYYLPNLWIRHRIKERKEQIFNTFPDALDLIRICVSSGLGLDAAIARVGKELNITSRALSEEFHQLNLELRAGATREVALKNLGTRTGVEDIQSLVLMLIQSIRFGTSVAESLRVHADGLRSKRQLKAQETAAKIPAKLSIPMILCIFPALFVVILGPSILRIMKMLAPIMGQP